MLRGSQALLLLVASLLQVDSAPASDVRSALDQAQRRFEEGDLTAARKGFEQLVPLLRNGESRQPLGVALNSLSLIYSDLGEYGEALDSAREAAQIRRALGDRTGEAESTNNAGLALLNLGDYAAALPEFRHALQLHRVGQEAEDEIIVLNNIGNVFFYQGRYLDALDRYQEALEVVRRSPGEGWSAHERLRTTVNMAALFQKLGRYDLALNLYSGLRSLPGVLSASENARVLSNLGALYRRLGDPVKALETYRSAQDWFRRQRHADGEIGTLKNIGIVLALDLGDLDAALRTFREVHKKAASVSSRRELVQAHLYTGETLRRLGRLDEAGKQFRAAFEGARALGVVEEQWKAIYGLGQIDGASGEHGSALKYYRQAIDLIESVRSRVRLASLRSDFLADKKDVYDAQISELLRAHETTGVPARIQDLELLHRALEESRARAFRDQMSEQLESLRGKAQPELLRELRELRARMGLVWASQLSPDGAKDASAESATLEARYLETERKLLREPGQPWESMESSLDEIRRRLDPASMLIEIWVGPDRIAALWATHASAGVVQRGLNDTGRRAMLACSGDLSRPDSTGWRNSCARAAELLLAELLPHVGSEIRTLLVIPDEHVSELPFEALPVPGEGKLVIQRWSVSYLPSASMIARTPRSGSWADRLPWSKTLAAFGDPVVAGQKTENIGGSSIDPDLPRLTYSREEVETVARLVGGRTRLFLGPDAVKSHLLGPDISGYRLLHLSTHAAIDPEYPQRSRVLFSPEAGSGHADFLFLGELFNVDLNGFDIVTFPACDTARGKIVRGEGTQDFSRALLINGAESTVSSLWRAADQPTAELMKQFYYYLAAGDSKAEALQKAKLRFLESGTALSHPYYWAAFILSGDGHGRVPLPISWSAFLLLSSGGLALLLAAVRFLRRLSHRR